MLIRLPLHAKLAIAAQAILYAVGLHSAAHAQITQIAQLGGFGTGGALQPPPVETGRPDRFVPGRAEGALPIGEWLLLPSAFGGLVYDSNVNQSTAGGSSSIGLRLVPSIVAETNDGISKTTVYGMADARLYTRQFSNGANATSARLGAIEDFRPQPDWKFTAQGDYTRQQDLFSNLGVDHSVTTLNPTGVGLAPTANPAAYNQFTAAASAQKNFSQAFAIAAGSVVGQVYDNTAAGAPSPNGIVYTVAGRGGLWITPAIYGYAEGSLDKRDYGTSALSSNGFRALAGLGSDQIGLFRGEVYGGYQGESYNAGGIGTVNTPVFGARGYYYPLPELNLSLAVDRALGASLLAATPASPAGSSTEVTSALLQANYSIAPEWSASARAGYIHTDYVGTGRRDDAWTVGPTVTYSVWRNFGITFDYQHLALNSNAVGQNFTRDVVTLGVAYRY